MSDALDKLLGVLDAGHSPSTDELKAALAVALQEREAIQRMVTDMAGWMSKMILARIQGDTPKIINALDAMMTEHVIVRDESKPSGSIH